MIAIRLCNKDGDSNSDSDNDSDSDGDDDLLLIQIVWKICGGNCDRDISDGDSNQDVDIIVWNSREDGEKLRH